MRVSDFLRISRIVKKAITSDEDGGDILVNMAQNLVTAQPLEVEINRCILSVDDVADDASRALYDIRRKIKINEQTFKRN